MKTPSKATSEKYLLRPADVMERRNCGRTQLYADIKAGLLPPPVVKSHRCVVWPVHEIVAISSAEAAGATVAERKALVKILLTRRERTRKKLLQKIMEQSARDATASAAA